jgi:chemotaxis protein CheX
MATVDAKSETRLAPVLLDCVQRAVLTTFAPTYGKKITCTGTNGNGHLTDGVVGIISLVGDVTWSLMIGLSRATAVGLTHKFAGVAIAFDSPDMSDITGEIANIIAGDASARFESAGVRAKLSLPTVARGDDIQILQGKCTEAICLHFTCPDGDFWLKVVAGSAAPARP